jgi:hypothetical protein
MRRTESPKAPKDRSNRRGCFIIGAVLVLFISALAYIGLRSAPVDEFNSSIPTVGAMAVQVLPAPLLRLEMPYSSSGLMTVAGRTS